MYWPFVWSYIKTSQNWWGTQFDGAFVQGGWAACQSFGKCYKIAQRFDADVSKWRLAHVRVRSL